MYEKEEKNEKGEEKGKKRKMYEKEGEKRKKGRRRKKRVKGEGKEEKIVKDGRSKELHINSRGGERDGGRVNGIQGEGWGVEVLSSQYYLSLRLRFLGVKNMYRIYDTYLTFFLLLSF